MRKVMYAMSVSLDGFCEAANGDLSWGNPDEELFQHFIEREARIDTHLLSELVLDWHGHFRRSNHFQPVT